MKSKIQGSLLGAAIGDGFGYATEFMDLKEIEAKWGIEGLRAPLGTIIEVTDDTQMAVSVAKAIMKTYQDGKILPDDFEKNLRKEFVTWMNDGRNNRAPGMTCMGSCRNLQTDMKWQDATNKDSKGCGANMRVNPVGLLKFKHAKISDKDIGKWAQFQAALTHAHATAMVAAELTALTVVKIMEGCDERDLVTLLLNHCITEQENYHEDFLGDVWKRPNIKTPEAFIKRGWKACESTLLKVREAIKVNDKETDPCNMTGEGWVAEEAFGTALVCFLFYPDDSVETLIRAVHTRGDSDSIACIAGGFVGARNGIASFPEDWVARLEGDYKEDLNQYLEFIVAG